MRPGLDEPARREPIDPERAAGLLGELVERSPDLRAAALVDAAGRQLAATDHADWASGVAKLWKAADRTGEGPATAVHVATEGGEVFGVRGRELAAAATSERFALAALALSDLRAVLRELEPPAPRTA